MSLIVIARNQTGNLQREDGTADYDVEVSVNRARIIFRGQVMCHVRAEGASKLLRLIADAIDSAPRKETKNATKTI